MTARHQQWCQGVVPTAPQSTCRSAGWNLGRGHLHHRGEETVSEDAFAFSRRGMQGEASVVAEPLQQSAVLWPQGGTLVDGDDARGDGAWLDAGQRYQRGLFGRARGFQTRGLRFQGGVTPRDGRSDLECRQLPQWSMSIRTGPGRDRHRSLNVAGNAPCSNDRAAEQLSRFGRRT
jgi:hypothetical protein